jgi:superkiller protein 3
MYGMHLKIVITLLVFVLFSGLHAYHGQDAGKDHLAAGKELAEAGDFDRALIAFDQFKQENSGDIRPYLRSGLALIDAGRLRDAEGEFSGAMVIGPKTADHALALASGLEKLERPVIASNVLSPFKSNPGLDPKGLWLLTELYQRQRRFDEALQALKAYETRARSNSERTYLLRGQIQLEAGQLEAAMSSFENVVQQNSRSAPAFDGLGQVCRLGNNPEAAERMSQRAVELEPRNPEYLHNLGIALKELGRNEEAVAALERASKSNPKTSRFYFDLGDAYRKVGRMPEAQKVMVKYQELLAVQLAEQELTQKLVEGEELLEAGKMEPAMQVFQQVLESDRQNWTAHNRLAKMYFTKGQLQPAYAHLKALLEIDPECSETQFLTAFYWYAKKDLDRSMAHAERAKRLRPGNADLRNLLGNLYFVQGNRNQALAEYAAATKLAPERKEFRIMYESVAGKPEPQEQNSPPRHQEH